MHPVVRDFIGRRPRMYGLLAMIVAVGAAWLGRIVPVPIFAFYLFVLSSMFGVTSAAHLAFGAKPLDWNWHSEAYAFPFPTHFWRIALTVFGWAVGLLVLSGLLYWVLR